jgi:hypothetical protein
MAEQHHTRQVGAKRRLPRVGDGGDRTSWPEARLGMADKTGMITCAPWRARADARAARRPDAVKARTA